MKIPTLSNLCLDELEIPDNVRKVLFSTNGVLEIDLDYNNRTTMVQKTLSVENVPIKLTKKHGYISKVSINVSNVHFLRTIELWFLIKLVHTTQRNSVAIPALKYRILRPDLVEINELVRLLDAPTFLKVVPYLKGWGVPDPSPFGYNDICQSARDTHSDAPCMVVFKKPLDEWCPTCVYRWAEFDERFVRHKKCCKGSLVKSWCESCLKMKSDMGWASLVHLMEKN